MNKFAKNVIGKRENLMIVGDDVALLYFHISNMPFTIYITFTT